MSYQSSGWRPEKRNKTAGDVFRESMAALPASLIGVAAGSFAENAAKTLMNPESGQWGRSMSADEWVKSMDEKRSAETDATKALGGQYNAQALLAGNKAETEMKLRDSAIKEAKARARSARYKADVEDRTREAEVRARNAEAMMAETQAWIAKESRQAQADHPGWINKKIEKDIEYIDWLMKEKDRLKRGGVKTVDSAAKFNAGLNDVRSRLAANRKELADTYLLFQAAPEDGTLKANLDQLTREGDGLRRMYESTARYGVEMGYLPGDFLDSEGFKSTREWKGPTKEGAKTGAETGKIGAEKKKIETTPNPPTKEEEDARKSFEAEQNAWQAANKTYSATYSAATRESLSFIKPEWIRSLAIRHVRSYLSGIKRGYNRNLVEEPTQEEYEMFKAEQEAEARRRANQGQQ